MTITEVSKKFNLKPDTLRYYEKVGLIDQVPKNARGVRDYRDSDLRRIEFIKCMRSAGLSIEVLVRYVKLYNQGRSTVSERKELLKCQRELLEIKMDEMKATLDKLSYKIEVYEEIENYDELILKRQNKELNRPDVE